MQKEQILLLFGHWLLIAVKNGDNPKIVANHLASAQRTARWE